MQRIKYRNIVQMIKKLALLEIDEILLNSQTFGYRERLKIERPLFCLLRVICKNEIDYNLRGFSQSHIDALRRNLGSGRRLLNIVDNIYGLRIFLRTLSSGSAYLRSEVLSGNHIKKRGSAKFIKNKVLYIFRNVEQLIEYRKGQFLPHR